MMSERKLSVREMKRIAHQIIDEEEQQWGIKLNVYPFTLIEYYTSDILKTNIKLYKSIMYDIKLPFNSFAINDNNGNAIIFLNSFDYYKKLNKKMYELIFTCYHEYRHSIQGGNYNPYSYNGFLEDLEYFIKVNGGNISVEHNKRSTEIGANLYAINKTKEYMQNNYPKLYERQKIEIENKEKKYISDYITFDTSSLIDQAIEIIKYKNIDINEVPDGLRILLNDDYSYKPISEIIELTKDNSIDKKIIYYTLSCNSFLESVNLEHLSNDELILFNESLKYTYTIYKNQQTSLEYLKKEKSIVNKITKLYWILHDNLSSILTFQETKTKEEHFKNIDKYLNETNIQINNQRKQ